MEMEVSTVSAPVNSLGTLQTFNISVQAPGWLILYLSSVNSKGSLLGCSDSSHSPLPSENLNTPSPVTSTIPPNQIDHGGFVSNSRRDPGPSLVRSQHLQLNALYILATEEICQPELIVVDQRINTVKCLVETREMLGDQPIYEIAIMQDLLERMTALTMSQGCLNDGCSSSKNKKPFANPMKILVWNCRGQGMPIFCEASEI